MAWTRVQSGSASHTGAGNVALTLTGVTVGNLLILNGANNGATTFSTVGDTVNTWTKITSKAGTGVTSEMWYAIVTTGGSLTITAQNGSFGSISVIEFNSGGGVISLDGTAATNSGGSTSPTTGNSTIVTPDLFVGGFGLSGVNSATMSSSGSYTADTTSYVAYVSGTHLGSGISYNLNANASPGNAAATLSSSENWTGIGVGFLVSTTVNGSGAITLGSLTPAGTGTFETDGTGAITLGALTPSGAGSFRTNGIGSIVLAALTPSGVGLFGPTGSGTITLGVLSSAGTGSFAVNGSGSIALASMGVAGVGSIGATLVIHADPRAGTLIFADNEQFSVDPRGGALIAADNEQLSADPKAGTLIN